MHCWDMHGSLETVNIYADKLVILIKVIKVLASSTHSINKPSAHLYLMIIGPMCEVMVKLEGNQ